MDGIWDRHGGAASPMPPALPFRLALYLTSGRFVPRSLPPRRHRRPGAWAAPPRRRRRRWPPCAAPPPPRGRGPGAPAPRRPGRRARPRALLDDDRDLPAYALGGPGGQCAEAVAPDLLVGLGQLTADGGAAVGAEDLGHRLQGGGEPVRRLEVDEGAALPGHLAQPPQPLPALRGRNPSKQNRSTGSPERASAVSTADGPGTAVMRSPRSTAAATRRYPGSETEGMPASVTSSTRAPWASSSTSSGCGRSRCPRSRRRRVRWCGRRGPG